MANYRKSRINGEITREMASIIRDVKDPRVSEAMLCITGADCSADLKQCKIYYSSLLSAENAPEIKKGLKSANGFIRSQLAKRLNLPVLLWGPRDPAPEGEAFRVYDTQCGLFATSKALTRAHVPFT